MLRCFHAVCTVSLLHRSTLHCEVDGRDLDFCEVCVYTTSFALNNFTMSET